MMFSVAHALLALFALPPGFGADSFFRPSLHPQPSAAILEARAQAEARRTGPAAGTCAMPTPPSPVVLSFPFGETELSGAPLGQLAEIADWLQCHREAAWRVAPQFDHRTSEAAQQPLAEQRMTTVRQYMHAQGLAAAGATVAREAPVVEILVAGGV